jgi:hypothetical protein
MKTQAIRQRRVAPPTVAKRMRDRRRLARRFGFARTRQGDRRVARRRETAERARGSSLLQSVAERGDAKPVRVSPSGFD